MLGTVTLLAMTMAMQPADPTRAVRETYTRCLRTYVERSLTGRMTPANFATAYPQQCMTEQNAYRAAVIAREVAARSSRADAEESATMEIDDARLNFSERFDMAQPETPAAAATPPAAAPVETPAAPAAAATTPPQPAPATPNPG
jgi:hypothetical protein